MIRTSVKVRLIVFVLLSATGLTYAGANYVGFLDPFLDPDYTITAQLDRSGGLYEGADVTYRGVPIGEVRELRVASGGTRAVLSIDEDWQVPANTRAEVHNQSAVGEQYLDLQPQSRGEPYLHDGSLIPNSRTSTPVPESELLLNIDQLVRSIDPDNLATVLDELGKAFKGTGPDLQRLIDSADALTRAGTRNLPQTTRLLEDAQTVLRTQNQQAGHIKSFARNLADLTETLRSSDRDIRTVIEDGSGAARQLNALLSSVEPTLPILLANLVTVSQVMKSRLPAIEQALVTFPVVISSGYTGTSPDGTGHVNVQLADLATPLCTKGYLPPDQWRLPSETSDIPAYTEARCEEGPPVSPRGSQSVLEGGTAPAAPDGSSGDPSKKKSPAGTRVAPYNPATGKVVAPNGQKYVLGTNGGQRKLLGEDSWKWLLIGPLAGG